METSWVKVQVQGLFRSELLMIWYRCSLYKKKIGAGQFPNLEPGFGGKRCQASGDAAGAGELLKGHAKLPWAIDARRPKVKD